VAFEDLYWMQKVCIILAIVVVDSVAEVICMSDGKLRILVAGKNCFILWPEDMFPSPTFWPRFCRELCDLYTRAYGNRCP